MWAISTCGEPNESKKNSHPKYNTALFRDRYTSGKYGSNFSVALKRVNYSPYAIAIAHKSGGIFRVGICLDFVGRSGTTRAEGPHVGPQYVRGAKRNRINRH